MKAGFVLVAAALTAVGPAYARGTVVFAGGAWAAIDRGDACEALARSAKIAPKGKVQPTAGFAFTPDHRRWGEFHAQLSRIPRPGSSVMLQVGNQPFLLVARDGWAWSRGPLQEQAIIAAVRYADGNADRGSRHGRACASPIPICSTALRPRSTQLRRVVPCARWQSALTRPR